MLLFGIFVLRGAKIAILAMDANFRFYFPGYFGSETKNRNIVKVNFLIKLYKLQRCYSFETLIFRVIL